jgi:hypothetical protein
MKTWKKIAYKKATEILRWHGLIVYFFYVVLRISDIGPTRLWLLLGRSKCIAGKTLDKKSGKVKPVWQDAGVLLILALVIVLTVLSAKSASLCWVFPLVAWMLLADIVAYHARVLWLDDLRTNRSWQRLRVFSHRRILFQGFFNFAESILLFGILYRYYGHFDNQQVDIYRESFVIATTLSSPTLSKLCPRLVNMQVGISLFFLIVVISIVASVGYTRKELAPTDRD